MDNANRAPVRDQRVRLCEKVSVEAFARMVRASQCFTLTASLLGLLELRGDASIRLETMARPGASVQGHVYFREAAKLSRVDISRQVFKGGLLVVTHEGYV